MEIKTKIENLIKNVLNNLGVDATEVVLEHPADFKNGDYSTNVAMVYAKQLKISPKELAEKIVEFLLPLTKGEVGRGSIKDINIAGSGFINFYLHREFFVESINKILEEKENWGKNKILKNKKVMVEYTQPNPFKPFHIGHLMSNAIGESISRIVEFSGAQTIRANYQGDVGLHVAKAIYGIMQSENYKDNLVVELPNELGSSTTKLATWIGECYSKGSDMYESDEQAKQEINTINKKVYDKSDEEINKIYDWGRKVTLEAFEEIYKILGTKFQHYFFESEMALVGEKIVRENIPKVFEESDGAIVFKAEKYDPKLHTRVFITSLGLPLYETKEIGLTMTKFEKENPDLSIVTTAIEQGEYMKVVQKAISIMHPELEKRMKHITHGMMRLASGKMSSRKGNVVTGESLLSDSISVVFEKMKDREMNEDEKKKISEIVGVSALKYSILRSSLESDIVYDFEKSISFEGDSGPYLQYTAVRAFAILKKAEISNLLTTDYLLHTTFPNEISNLERMLYQFPEIVVRSYEQLEPHHIATYLTELASVFNSFYANTHILNDENQYKDYHIAIVQSFYTTMKNGLYLLGIQTPKRM